MFNRTARPKGYTGGLRSVVHSDSYREVHWLETFEEAMNAIEHLEAAGNKIPLDAISNYENETVDAKYCFILNTYGTKRLKKGEEWYDRKLVNPMNISYFGFLDKVTIDELEYSYYDSYKTICVGCSDRDVRKRPDTSVELVYEYVSDETGYGGTIYYYDIVEKGTLRRFASMACYNIEDHWSELPADFHEEFPKTIVYIGEE
jgi:hypothetical protein